MKNRFAKTALALAVAGTLSAPAFANTDEINRRSGLSGFDGLAEQSSRSAALQQSYFSHADRDNIWVNPALATEYSNGVEFNRTNGRQYAGLLYSLAPNQTLGFYLRNNQSDFAEKLEFLGGMNVGAGFHGSQSEEEAENQFDIFYAIDLGDMAFGARLNYQAIDRSRSAGDRIQTDARVGLNGDTGASVRVLNDPRDNATLDQIIAQTRQEAEAALANDEAALAALRANAQYAAGQLDGDVNVTNTNLGRWSQDASEVNLSLGFNIKSLGIDGAVLIGQASGEQSRSRSVSAVDTGYGIVNGAQVTRLNSTFNETWRETAEIDDGLSFGLALRGLVMQTESSTLHASFLYSSQDYSGQLSSVRSREQVQNTFDAVDQQTVTSTTTTTQDQRFSGHNIDEREVIQLGASFRTLISDSTAATAMLGFRMENHDGGYDVTRVADSQVVSVNNVNADNTVARTWSAPYGETERERTSYESMSLPLVLALEHSVNERWTLRGSVSKELYRSAEYTSTTTNYNGVNVANAVTPTATDLTTEAGPNRTVAGVPTSVKEEQTWNTPTTVALGLGYTNNGVTVDTLLQTGNGSAFAGITLGYQW